MAPPPNGPDDGRAPGVALDSEAFEAWFISEVLPLEPALTRMLRRHWRRTEDLADLRQEIYISVYESAARNGIPRSVAAYVFTCARNLLVNKARRAQIVQFDLVSELDSLPSPPLEPWTPEQITIARAEFELLRASLDDLPPRCREVLRLRKVEGLSQKEIALRLGISEGTVEKQVSLGVRAIAEDLASRGVDAAATWLQQSARRSKDT
jgi:RNA polymerase sigma-70 factor (ECF subfamily)